MKFFPLTLLCAFSTAIAQDFAPFNPPRLNIAPTWQDGPIVDLTWNDKHPQVLYWLQTREEFSPQRDWRGVSAIETPNGFRLPGAPMTAFFQVIDDTNTFKRTNNAFSAYKFITLTLKGGNSELFETTGGYSLRKVRD